MSDERRPACQCGVAPRCDEALLRRKELLHKVREANKRSITGPDSPTLHLYRSDMLKPVMRKVEVPGDAVCRGDLLEVGGLLHRVKDVRELDGRRRCLEFEDGNAYVTGPGVTTTVARAYEPNESAWDSSDRGIRQFGNDSLEADFG